jgi:hypothetical protein
MKKITLALAILVNLNALAEDPQRIICHDDQRLSNGPLREIVLTTDENNNYFLQSSFVASLSAPDILIEKWAVNLACKIDEKVTIAYCQNPSGQSAIQISERREVYYDSLEADAKKKTRKSIDISLLENGEEKKELSFDASDCQSLFA